VRDRGPGIAPHVVKDLFVPFFTTKPKGTGLGLAISRRIVEDMAGLIEVSSQEGQGATFTVLLPVAEDPLLAPRFEAPRADPAASAGSGASAPSASEAEPAVPAGEPLTRPL
jgi:hypothetical protein